jgi:hypothetical protein
MHRLYTEANQYGLERQRSLKGLSRRELATLRNGRLFDAGEWFAKAGKWLFDQLAYLGSKSPCFEYDLACEAQFMA